MDTHKTRLHRSPEKTPSAPAESGAQTISGAAETLPQLAEQIRRAYAETEEHVGRLGTALQAATEHALGVGRLLNRAKELVPHGGWERWLADSVPGLSPRTARRWMQEAKRPTLADLNPGDRAMSPREAVRFLSESPDRAKVPRPAATGRGRAVAQDPPEAKDPGQPDESDRDEDGIGLGPGLGIGDHEDHEGEEDSIDPDATGDPEEAGRAAGQPVAPDLDRLVDEATALAGRLESLRRRRPTLGPRHIFHLRGLRTQIDALLDSVEGAGEGGGDAVGDLIEASARARRMMDQLGQPDFRLCPEVAAELRETERLYRGFLARHGAGDAAPHDGQLAGGHRPGSTARSK
ncbi:MAG: DUF3102 domain-containing protein [Verrucomicrobiae bacterium]|nr:DUF3102 domain-containing protein [Verrucomicrobiae bacterium]